MLKIYHAARTRSLRIVWLAEEMGLPYTLVSIPFGGPKPADFIDVSPLGQLPAIEDGDVRMVESIAIMQYLLAKYGPSPLALTPNDKDFAAYLQFLEYGEAGLCAIGNALIATRFMAPDEEKKNWTATYVLKAMGKRVEVIEKRLQGREYIAGDRFTAADISVGYALGVQKFVGVFSEPPPNYAAYYARLTARPAYQRATAAA